MLELARGDDVARAIVASIPAGPPGVKLEALRQDFGLHSQRAVADLLRRNYPHLGLIRRRHPDGGVAVFWDRRAAPEAEVIGWAYMRSLAED